MKITHRLVIERGDKDPTAEDLAKRCHEGPHCTAGSEDYCPWPTTRCDAITEAHWAKLMKTATTTISLGSSSVRA